MFRFRGYLNSGPFVDLTAAVHRLVDCDVAEVDRCRDEVLAALRAFEDDLVQVGTPATKRARTESKLCLTCGVPHDSSRFSTRNQFTCTLNDKRWLDLFRVHKSDLRGALDVRDALLKLAKIKESFPRRIIKPVVLPNRDVVFQIEHETKSFEDWLARRERLDKVHDSVGKAQVHDVASAGAHHHENVRVVTPRD